MVVLILKSKWGARNVVLCQSLQECYRGVNPRYEGSTVVPTGVIRMAWCDIDETYLDIAIDTNAGERWFWATFSFEDLICQRIWAILLGMLQVVSLIYEDMQVTHVTW